MKTRVMATVLGLATAAALVPAAGSGQCEPVEVARVAVGGDANEIEASGDFRFVAWGSEGLVVLEADGPDEMERVGSLVLGVEARTLEIGAGVVFVGGGSEVFAVDVSTPRYPTLLDSFDVGGTVNELDLRGGVLYVAAAEAGLRIVDVSTPAAMSLRGSLATAAPAWGVDAAGTKAYLTTDDGGMVLDVSNPSSPVVLSDNAPGTGTVRTTQTRAYVEESAGVLHIVDISDPTSPEVIASWTADGFGSGWITGLRAVTGTLYVTNGDTDYKVDPCAVDVDWAQMNVFDVTGDSFALVARSDYMHSHRYSSVSIADGRIMVTQDQPWDGVRVYEVSALDVVERGRFIGVEEIAQPNGRPFATSGGAAVGAWIARYPNRRSEVYFQSVLFRDGDAPSVKNLLLPALNYPFSHWIESDGEIVYVVVIEEDGPRGADCFPDIATTRVHAVDLSDPGEPTIVGSAVLSADDDAAQIALELGARMYAWYYGPGSGVDIYDTTAPDHLAAIGSFTPFRPNNNSIQSLAGHSEHVYTVMTSGQGGTDGLFQVYDAVDPEDVALVSSQTTDWVSVHIVGSQLVGASTTDLVVHELSDPGSPVELSRTPFAHAWSRISISGELLAYGDQHQISVLDLSDPSDPRMVATMPGAETFALAEDGGVLFAVNDGQIVKHAVVTPRLMEILATAPTADTAFDVALAPNLALAYVSDLAGGVRVFDVSDPADPAAVDAFTGLDRAYQTVVLGGPGAELGYIASGESGLVVISAEIPTAHGLVGSLATSDLALALAVRDGYAYVATRFDGLQIVDVSVPGEPVLVGAVDTPGSAQGVTLDGNLAYIADGSGGVHVVDVSNRSLPTIIGSYDTPHSARMVAIQGSVAYVPDRSTGLLALDVSDPTDPRPIAALGGLGDARGVTVSGPHAFVADFEGLVHKIDITDPGAMKLVQSLPTLSTPRALAYDAGGMLYVADGDAGLTVIESRPCWDRSCPVDVNDDGSLDFFDVQGFLNAYAASEGLADWNDDGAIDFFDLQSYLNGFAAGCP